MDKPNPDNRGEFFDQFLDDYYAECDEHLVSIRRALVTLEDEDGAVNVVVWPDLAERQRRELIGSRLLAVQGRWETVDGVQHIIAHRLQDLSSLLGALQVRSYDFH